MTSANLRHLEVGVEEDVDPDNLSPSTVVLPDLETTGYSGSSTTRSGSIAANVVRATLTTTPITLCSTGRLPHVGRWRVRARVYGASIPDDESVYVRLAWRVGDAPFTREPWVLLPGESDWFDPLLAILDIQEIASGTHAWEARIEGRSSSGNPTIDLDQVGVFPAANYSRMSAPLPALTADPIRLISEDGFEQTSGSLAGKADELGNTWSGAGDADDFTIDTSGDRAQRASVSDGAGTPSIHQSGRIALIGPSIAATDVQVKAQASAPNATTDLYQGVAARYVDPDNWMGFFGQVAGAGATDGALTAFMFVGGSLTTLDSLQVPAWDQQTAPRHYRLRVFDGYFEGYVAEVVTTGSLVWQLMLRGFNDELTASGDLAEGRAGFLDAYTLASPARTRYYDDFSASEIEDSIVKYADGEVLLSHQDALRLSEDGYFMGQVPTLRGQYLTVPPATRAGRVSRIAVKGRRLDVDDGMPDIGVSDTLSADLSVTPRVQMISKVLP